MKNLLLTAAVKADDTTKAISILAYNGSLMRVPNWGDVAIDLTAVDLPDQIPLLIDHTNAIDCVCGHGSPKIIEGKLFIQGKLLTETAAGQKLLELNRGGLKLQASIGLEPSDYERINPNQSITCNGQSIKSERPFTLIKAGVLKETSITPIGCDSQTAVQIAAMQKINHFDNKGVSMNSVVELRAAAQRYDGLLGKEQIDQIILATAEAGEGTEQLQDRILSAVKLKQVQASRPTTPRVGFDDKDGSFTSRDVLLATWCFKLGRDGVAEKRYASNPRVLEAASRNRRMDVMTLMGAGQKSPDELLASFSTNDTATVFTDALKLVAFEKWGQLPQTWPLISKKRSVPNFHQHSTPRPYLKDGQLQEVGPAGELKHGQLGDENYSVQAKTKGKMFGITRTDLINDDLGAVVEYVESLQYEGYRTLMDDLFDALKGASYFSTVAGNYAAGAGTALSIDALSDAMELLRSQTDAAGRVIDVRPKTLLVPPALESTARQLIVSTLLNRTGDKDPIGNPWHSLDLQFLVEPRLSTANGGSDTSWYLVSDPNLVPAMTVSFLNGNERPTIEQNSAAFNVLGEQWRCYFDYGCDLADHRAIVKMLGAAEN